jgi:hypothetical protein
MPERTPSRRIVTRLTLLTLLARAMSAIRRRGMHSGARRFATSLTFVALFCSGAASPLEPARRLLGWSKEAPRRG